MSIRREDIVDLFGGTTVVAQICGVTAGAVSQWEYVPSRHQQALLKAARERDIDLSAEKMVMGLDHDRPL